MLTIKTILHPTDFSESSDYAFRLACMLARDHGGRVVVLHVAIPPTVASVEGALIPQSIFDAKALKEKLAAIQTKLPGVDVERCLVVDSNVAGEILRVAEDRNCDLIVMGSHGRTGLKRVLLGSIAELVLRRATCPVLTVKQPYAPRMTEESMPDATKELASSR